MCGLKFCHLDFGKVAEEYSSLQVFVDGTKVVEGVIVEALEKLSYLYSRSVLDNCEVVNTWICINQFVLELASPGT